MFFKKGNHYTVMTYIFPSRSYSSEPSLLPGSLALLVMD